MNFCTLKNKHQAHQNKDKSDGQRNKKFPVKFRLLRPVYVAYHKEVTANKKKAQQIGNGSSKQIHPNG